MDSLAGVHIFGALVGVNGPLRSAIFVCAAAAFVCWLLSVLTKNYSWVDRAWSLLPQVYVAMFAAARDFVDPRLNTMLVLTCLWGARLTFNFARKGGYRWSGEDYRWPILRARLGPVGFQLFNATFIAPYQNLILLLIALPAWTAYQHPRPLGALDVLAALAFVAFLVGETVADEQQWRFHQKKARGEASGFLSDGLFRYSRHPNFFCEQAMWWCVYAFAVAASGAWLSVTIVGAVLLTLLFKGSTAFTERISLGKYPAYNDYQRTTSRLLPLPPRRPGTIS
jgi:steroid 5-alpha reductase family enzyme